MRISCCQITWSRERIDLELPKRNRKGQERNGAGGGPICVGNAAETKIPSGMGTEELVLHASENKIDDGCVGAFIVRVLARSELLWELCEER